MAKDGGFEGFIGKERARLEKAREETLAKRSEADKELQAIQSEFDAIEAYERVKTDRIARPARKARGRRGEKRQSILDLIKQHPKGLSRGEILAALRDG